MTGFVYIIRCDDFVKIGYSRTPERRIRALASYSPHPMTVLAVFPGTDFDERQLHRYLAEFRHRGEWFRWCDRIAEIVAHGIPRATLRELWENRIYPSQKISDRSWLAHVTPEERDEIADFDRIISESIRPIKDAKMKRGKIQRRATVRAGKAEK